MKKHEKDSLTTTEKTAAAPVIDEIKAILQGTTKHSDDHVQQLSSLTTKAISTTTATNSTTHGLTAAPEIVESGNKTSSLNNNEVMKCYFININYVVQSRIL